MTTSPILSLDRLKEEAEQRAGLDDYGNDNFWPHLEILLDALNNEAQLNEAGVALQFERLVELLVNRLRLQYFLKKYPEIEQETINSPIVILGPPRSGTTMLQRLMSVEDQLLSTTWYEMRFPVPEPDWDFTDANDQRITKAKAEVAALIEANPDLLAIHPLDAMEADEDLLLLENSFLTEMPASQANVPSYNDHYLHSDAEDVYRFHKRMLQFLQWQRRRKGQAVDGKRWVLKAPAHMHHIPSIRAVYPDAQYVVSQRDPVEVVPSISSFYYALWQVYTDHPDPLACGRHTAYSFLRGMALTRQQQEKDPENFKVFDYRELVKNPENLIEELYDFLGLTLTDETREKIRRWREENKREKRPPHKYTLEEFGLSEEGIRTQAKELLDQALAENP